MLRTIQDFLDRWQEESTATLKMFEHLTDESLSKRFTGVRTIGRLANHIIETLSELPEKLGLPIKEETAAYNTVDELVAAYKRASGQLVKAVTANWNDEILDKETNMYGDTWKNGFSLWVILVHQSHHRAQMTILMRLSGLKVPGVYGPSKEEWQAFNLAPME